MDAAALSAALGKSLNDLGDAIRDAQRTGLMQLKPKIEAVAKLQHALNYALATELVAIRRELDGLKGGANG